MPFSATVNLTMQRTHPLLIVQLYVSLWGQWSTGVWILWNQRTYFKATDKWRAHLGRTCPSQAGTHKGSDGSPVLTLKWTAVIRIAVANHPAGRAWISLPLTPPPLRPLTSPSDPAPFAPPLPSPLGEQLQRRSCRASSSHGGYPPKAGAEAEPRRAMAENAGLENHRIKSFKNKGRDVEVRLHPGGLISSRLMRGEDGILGPRRWILAPAVSGQLGG